MANIIANVSLMFETIEPWDVSNSVMNLGESAGRITWDNALKIAGEREKWLVSSYSEACEGMQEWARDTGAWDAETIAAWTDLECLALFVQNIASELREYLGVDDHDIGEALDVYECTDWEAESGSPTGYYYHKASDAELASGVDSDVMVEYYTGC